MGRHRNADLYRYMVSKNKIHISNMKTKYLVTSKVMNIKILLNLSFVFIFKEIWCCFGYIYILVRNSMYKGECRIRSIDYISHCCWVNTLDVVSIHKLNWAHVQLHMTSIYYDYAHTTSFTSPSHNSHSPMMITTTCHRRKEIIENNQLLHVIGNARWHANDVPNLLGLNLWCHVRHEIGVCRGTCEPHLWARPLRYMRHTRTPLQQPNMDNT